MVVGVGGSRKTCQWYQRIRIDRHRWERRVYKVCITDNQQYHFPKGDSIIKILLLESRNSQLRIPNRSHPDSSVNRAEDTMDRVWDLFTIFTGCVAVTSMAESLDLLWIQVYNERALFFYFYFFAFQSCRSFERSALNRPQGPRATCLDVCGINRATPGDLCSRLAGMKRAETPKSKSFRHSPCPWLRQYTERRMPHGKIVISLAIAKQMWICKRWSHVFQVDFYCIVLRWLNIRFYWLGFTYSSYMEWWIQRLFGRRKRLEENVWENIIFFLYRKL